MKIQDEQLIKKIKDFKDQFDIDFTDYEMHDKGEILRSLESLSDDARSLKDDIEEKAKEDHESF